MDLDVRQLTGFIVVGAAASMLGLSYVAAYLLGKNAGRREAEHREPPAAVKQPDRIDRIESVVDSIAVEVERLAEGQRFMLGSRGAERAPQPVLSKPERRHSTPV